MYICLIACPSSLVELHRSAFLESLGEPRLVFSIIRLFLGVSKVSDKPAVSKVYVHLAYTELLQHTPVPT